MNKLSLLGYCGIIILGGCTKHTLYEPEVSRDQVYYGQPVADLAENFGAPTRAEQYDHGVLVYVYNRADIVKDYSGNKIKDCEIRFYTQNDRVIDWEWQGSDCQFGQKYIQRLLYDDHDAFEVDRG